MRPARLLALTPLLAGLLSTALPPAPALAADDYPWRADTTRSADPWGFVKRQCTSFAAFRLARAGHRILNGTGHWGDAAHWDTAAAAHHMVISRRPVPGSIAQWNAGERSGYYSPGSSTANGWVQAGPYGHVGYVTSVYADGSARVEQYNLNGARAWSATRVRAPRYLYVR